MSIGDPRTGPDFAIPSVVFIEDERCRFHQNPLAELQIELNDAQQAIREMKRDIDMLRMLSGLSIGGIGIIALAVGLLTWGMW